MRRLTLLAACTLALLLPACSGAGPQEVPPDQRFGHRYETRGPGGREVIHITPPAEETEYFYYPAIVDTLHVRPAAFEVLAGDEEATTRVEVLVKGSFPDGCSELHEIEQSRAGHLVDVELTMRRAKGAVCTQVVRPYRFYVLLDGRYGPGDYRLDLNGSNYTFTLRPRSNA